MMLSISSLLALALVLVPSTEASFTTISSSKPTAVVGLSLNTHGIVRVAVVAGCSGTPRPSSPNLVLTVQEATSSDDKDLFVYKQPLALHWVLQESSSSSLPSGFPASTTTTNLRATANNDTTPNGETLWWSATTLATVLIPFDKGDGWEDSASILGATSQEVEASTQQTATTAADLLRRTMRTGGASRTLVVALWQEDDTTPSFDIPRVLTRRLATVPRRAFSLKDPTALQQNVASVELQYTCERRSQEELDHYGESSPSTASRRSTEHDDNSSSMSSFLPWWTSPSRHPWKYYMVFIVALLLSQMIMTRNPSPRRATILEDADEEDDDAQAQIMEPPRLVRRRLSELPHYNEQESVDGIDRHDDDDSYQESSPSSSLHGNESGNMDASGSEYYDEEEEEEEEEDVSLEHPLRDEFSSSEQEEVLLDNDNHDDEDHDDNSDYTGDEAEGKEGEGMSDHEAHSEYESAASSFYSVPIPTGATRSEEEDLTAASLHVLLQQPVDTTGSTTQDYDPPEWSTAMLSNAAGSLLPVARDTLLSKKNYRCSNDVSNGEHIQPVVMYNEGGDSMEVASTRDDCGVSFDPQQLQAAQQSSNPTVDDIVHNSFRDATLQEDASTLRHDHTTPMDGPHNTSTTASMHDRLQFAPDDCNLHKCMPPLTETARVVSPHEDQMEAKDSTPATKSESTPPADQHESTSVRLQQCSLPQNTDQENESPLQLPRRENVQTSVDGVSPQEWQRGEEILTQFSNLSTPCDQQAQAISLEKLVATAATSPQEEGIAENFFTEKPFQVWNLARDEGSSSRNVAATKNSLVVRQATETEEHSQAEKEMEAATEMGEPGPSVLPQLDWANCNASVASMKLKSQNDGGSQEGIQSASSPRSDGDEKANPKVEHSPDDESISPRNDCGRDHDDSSSSYVSTLPPDSDLVSEDANIQPPHRELPKSGLNVGDGLAHGNNSPRPSFESGSPQEPPQPWSTNDCPNSSSVAIDANELFPSPSSAFEVRGKRALDESPSSLLSPRDAKVPRLDEPEEIDFPMANNECDDLSSVEIFQVTSPLIKKKRKSRPFLASQIVPDWVPSKGLQVASENFEDSKWTIGLGDASSTKTPNAKPSVIPKAISIRRVPRKNMAA